MIPVGNNNVADSIGASPFIRPGERTVIDKLFARDDIEKVRELLKKENLKRVEWQELEHYLTSLEPKLQNLEPDLMYKLSKFMVTVSSAVSLSGYFADCAGLIEKELEKGKLISLKARNHFKIVRARVDRSTKLLYSVFTYSGRVTLSNKALAFKEFTRAQWEQQYNMPMGQKVVPERGYVDVNNAR